MDKKFDDLSPDNANKPFRPPKSQNFTERIRLPRLIGIAFVVIFLIVIAFMSTVNIPAGHVGVIYDLIGGVKEMQLGEGTHIIPPWWYVTEINVRQQTFKTVRGEVKGINMAIDVRSKDLLDVVVDQYVIYHVDPANAWQLYKYIGIDYEGVVIAPIVRGVSRDVLSQYTAEQINVMNRSQIESQIAERIRAEFQKKWLIMDNFVISRVDIPKSVSDAIEEKKAMEQLVQKKQYEVDRQKLEAQRVIIEAEANAKALELTGKAVRENPEVLQLRYIDMLKEQKITTMIIPSGGALPIIPLPVPTPTP